MTDEARSHPVWLDSLSQIPIEARQGQHSIRELFEMAAPNIHQQGFTGLLRAYFAARPEVIRAWQNYSYDKRSSPSPYIDGLEVGFMDDQGRSQDVRRYDDAAAACADFVFREAVWVLERRRAVDEEVDP